MLFSCFQTWPEVLTHVAAGAAVYYHAPLDTEPRLVRVRRTFKNGKLRIDPCSSDADNFTADAGHLPHFRRVERPELTDFLLGYATCALWSSNDESDPDGGGGEPLDKNYSIEDIADDCLARMAADCERFRRENADDLAAVDSELAAMPRDGSSADEMAGHLFWLARNGHGTGYWDRGLGDAGDRLSEASSAFGEVYLETYNGKVDGHY